MIRVECNYPNEDLSPNARVHRMALWRAKKTAKDSTAWLTKAAKGNTPFKPEGRIPLRLTWHPVKGKATPDQDNAIATVKAHIDGLAIGLGVNDKMFDLTYVEGAPVPNGAVVFEVGA